MAHSIFGWSYPQTEEIWALLEDAGVDEAVIEKVCEIVTTLEYQAANDSCAECERRAAQAEQEAGA